METLSREQIKQAISIATFDMELEGAIRLWACDIHGQQKVSYNYEDGKVNAKCGLCCSSNQWIKKVNE